MSRWRHIGSEGADLKETLFSREKAVELPIAMSVLGYLAARYGVPKYSFQMTGLQYHYTDAAGLAGILSSNRLWATDSRFLNDPSEGKLFPERILDFMRNKTGGLTAIEAGIIDHLAAGVTDDSRRVDAFSVSFCEDGDLLSQWRAYGSFGAGYAIGFDLRNAPHLQIGRAIKVEYDFAHLEPLALDLLSIYVEASEKWRSVINDMCREDGGYALRWLSLGFKDRGYHEEKETRVLVSPNDREDDLFREEAPLRFRARGPDVVPYIPMLLQPLRDGFPAPKLPIRSIVTGPGVDYQRNRSSLEQLLRYLGYHGVDIGRSVIPFRG